MMYMKKHDIFRKAEEKPGPLGQYAEIADGYYMFPYLEGPPSARMRYKGKEVIVWSINNYLGLANHPYIRRIDAEATMKWGLASPMGARMMTGETPLHIRLEELLANLLQKESVMLFNYGYQGLTSTIDALLDRDDVVIYDAECHACIIDGVRLHRGAHFSYRHNDISHLEERLKKASEIVVKTGGGILVITEGVFGMRGDMGLINEIVKLKEKYEFRLLVDDAHGIGVLSQNGKGTCHLQGVSGEVDLIFGTFAKAFASIGAFIGGPTRVINFLKHNNRSQIFSKSLPLPIVYSNIHRVKLAMENEELRIKLHHISRFLKEELGREGFSTGNSNTPVTPVFLHGTPFTAANLVADLRENKNIFVSMVVYPVVPKDVILLRLIPTAEHTHEDVHETIEAFKYVREKMEKSLYPPDRIIFHTKITDNSL